MGQLSQKGGVILNMKSGSWTPANAKRLFCIDKLPLPHGPEVLSNISVRLTLHSIIFFHSLFASAAPL